MSAPEDRQQPSRRRRRRRGRPRSAPELPAAAAPLAAPRRLDESKPAEAPLSAAEIAAIAQHFRFIARHRSVLRLKLNAAEDLLVNGARPPEHRGVCLHLLGKVDRATVSAALARLPDAESRTRLLDGVVRFSTDVAMVLSYLESLSASASRADAALALGAGLRRIDFAAASPAQMRRLFDLMVQLFERRDLPKLVLDLLAGASFRAAALRSADTLPPALADVFLPLSAVHAAVVCGEDNPHGPEHLARGVLLLLDAPGRLLTSHDEPVRERLLAFAVAHAPAGKERALTTLLATFPKEGRTHSRLAMELARRLMAARQYDAARALLEEVRAAHRDFRLPGQWLAALAAPRLGAIALLDPPSGARLRRGFWFERQLGVYVRQSEAEAARLHEALLIPGLLPVVVRDGDLLAVPSWGAPLFRARLEPASAPRLALDGVMLLSALAAAGVLLADAELGRFLYGKDGRLWLADLCGAAEAPNATAEARHLELARRWCIEIFALARAEPPEAAALASDLRGLARQLASTSR